MFRYRRDSRRNDGSNLPRFLTVIWPKALLPVFGQPRYFFHHVKQLNQYANAVGILRQRLKRFFAGL
jgi:hypothetical protein